MIVKDRLHTVFLVLGVVLTVIVGAPIPASSATGPEFCWRDSSTRGVGQVPVACAPGQERIGLLCYDQCGPGMQRFGFDCHSVCPAGMADQGLFCRRAEYGRGAGYAWQFGDALNDNGMRSRCERDNGAGNCEKSGLIFYPKCKPGYTAAGCCICRPEQPDCTALGLNPGVDLSCAKKVVIGNPQVGICGPGEQRDAGLCYPNCPSGFAGVGPVCWSDKPVGWVNCGMGKSKDSVICGSIVFGQVASVGQMAIFVASLGTSSAASGAANTAQASSRLAKLKAQYDQMKAAWEGIKNIPGVTAAIKVAENANRVRKGFNATQTLISAVTEEDMARAAAQIAAILDPSGVSSSVASYTYPKCSKYFPAN